MTLLAINMIIYLVWVLIAGFVMTMYKDNETVKKITETLGKPTFWGIAMAIWFVFTTASVGAVGVATLLAAL